MALFSFRHSVKTFSEKRTSEARSAKVGQTAAHLRYITRPQAARIVMRERLTGTSDAKTAKDAETAAQRRKGRACERFIVALPLEATPEQRAALARAFAEKLTGGVAGYVVAIHDKHGNDRDNPHFHLAAFDVMVRSGSRARPRSTLGMARKQAIETTAKMWADLHNDMMTRWGHGPGSTISHLSLEDQGHARIPTIHEGPTARRMSTEGKVKKSKDEWRNIDEGRSRAEANKIIREINQAKEQLNEREHRLGRHDDKSRAQRHCGGVARRAVGRRIGKSLGNPTPPFSATGRAQGCLGYTGNSETRPAFPAGAARPKRHGQCGSQSPFFRLGPCRSAGGRHGVRRIYRELIWLRDTLRSRLLSSIDVAHHMKHKPPAEPMRSTVMDAAAQQHNSMRMQRRERTYPAQEEDI